MRTCKLPENSSLRSSFDLQSQFCVCFINSLCYVRLSGFLWPRAGLAGAHLKVLPLEASVVAGEVSIKKSHQWRTGC